MNQKSKLALLLALVVGGAGGLLSPSTIGALQATIAAIDFSPSLEAIRPRIDVVPFTGAHDSEEVGYKRLGSPVEQGPTLLSRSECYGVIMPCLRDGAALS